MNNVHLTAQDCEYFDNDIIKHKRRHLVILSICYIALIDFKLERMFRKAVWVTTNIYYTVYMYGGLTSLINMAASLHSLQMSLRDSKSFTISVLTER